jgi:hypothetical protein
MIDFTLYPPKIVEEFHARWSEVVLNINFELFCRLIAKDDRLNHEWFSSVKNLLNAYTNYIAGVPTRIPPGLANPETILKQVSKDADEMIKFI